MKKVFLLFMLTPAFASPLHYVSQTLKPTAKVAYYAGEAASYPARHPVKTAKGFGKFLATVF